jgi:hypothetical protein
MFIIMICVYVCACNNLSGFCIVVATPPTIPPQPSLFTTPNHHASISSTPCNWNALSVFQQMQNNTDHMVNHTVEMQEMRKLIQYQQEQHKLTIGYLGFHK